jgi:hypothetical protein
MPDTMSIHSMDDANIWPPFFPVCSVLFVSGQPVRFLILSFVAQAPRLGNTHKYLRRPIAQM